MINIILLVAAFLFMEFVAWSNHKYVMHGFLWKWHKDHHIKDKHSIVPQKVEESRFEKNDLFFLIYAIPAIILIIVGLGFNVSALVYIGAGITLYGFTYFVIHDVIIHKRLNIPFLHKNHSHYIKAVLRAHSAHHWGRNVRDFKNYGLLIFPKRFFKE